MWVTGPKLSRSSCFKNVRHQRRKGTVGKGKLLEDMPATGMVYPLRYSPMLLHFLTYIGTGPSDGRVLGTECGQSVMGSSRIAGGEEALQGEFPWMVSIRYKNQHYCGGALISALWILTAAHCFRRLSNASQAVTVVVGGYQQSAIESGLEGKAIRVDRIITHPRFDNQFYVNDLALVRLRKPVTWDSYTQPVCLPDADSQLHVGSEAIVTGWGWSSESRKGGRKSNVLKKLSVKVVDNRECTMWYREANYPMTFQPQQLCAGYKEGGKDACQGDSGGPLVLKDKDSYKLIGVVSSGVGCARPLLPGLYTRVSTYLPWIAGHVGALNT